MKKLTERQVDVLRHAADGLTNQEIADRIGIGPESVKSHLYEAYKRLGAHNRMQAVNLARDAEYIA